MRIELNDEGLKKNRDALKKLESIVNNPNYKNFPIVKYEIDNADDLILSDVIIPENRAVIALVFVTTKRFEIRELMFKGSPIKFDNEL
jgi:hypothetical protein